MQPKNTSFSATGEVEHLDVISVKHYFDEKVILVGLVN